MGSNTNIGMKKLRHASVPFNKSIYARTNAQESSTSPKTFFKGAVEFLRASKNNSLGDQDHGVKKILDDTDVQKHFEKSVKKSNKDDVINSG